jgi:nucleotide-binding universal stress UspA family protein
VYDAILYPTDGSEGGRDAFERAVDLAQTYDASLHVLFVADTTRDSVTVVGTEIVDALEQEGESVVESLADEARGSGVDAEGEVVQGEPASAIVEYAELRDADLVVMPTHGRSGLDRYVLGSVTESVVRRADVPVLTVPFADTEE